LPFTFDENKVNTTVITHEIIENYLAQIVILLQEILNVEIPFEEKIN
jgi:hypothetical protein